MKTLILKTTVAFMPLLFSSHLLAQEVMTVKYQTRGSHSSPIISNVELTFGDSDTMALLNSEDVKSTNVMLHYGLGICKTDLEDFKKLVSCDPRWQMSSQNGSSVSVTEKDQNVEATYDLEKQVWVVNLDLSLYSKDTPNDKRFDSLQFVWIVDVEYKDGRRDKIYFKGNQSKMGYYAAKILNPGIVNTGIVNSQISTIESNN